MKVLFAINSLIVGGAERVFVDQVNNFNQQKFDVWVMNTVAEQGKTFRDELKLPQDKIVQFNFKRVLDIPELIKVHKFFKKQKFEAVITSLYLTNFVGRLVAKINKVPVICSYEQNVYERKTKLQISADRWLAKFTDVIFAVSNEVKEFTSRQEKIPLDKFVVNYNAIPLATKELSAAEKQQFKSALGIPPEALVITNAGRLVEQKGQRYLILAAKKVVEQNKRQQIYFLICGSGGLKDKLFKEAQSLGIDDKIILPGVLPINKVLSITDIFVMPSLREGLSLVMLEAMVYGKPMVLTEVSGAREAIIDGADGFLVPIKNPQALAEKISILVNNPRIRQRFSQQAKERVKKFSIDKNVKILENQLLKIYQQKIVKTV